ncbi:hypothetical protein BH11BAC4_BH11BAC4_04650 [soil metagenome]
MKLSHRYAAIDPIRSHTHRHKCSQDHLPFEAICPLSSGSRSSRSWVRVRLAKQVHDSTNSGAEVLYQSDFGYCCVGILRKDRKEKTRQCLISNCYSKSAPTISYQKKRLPKQAASLTKKLKIIILLQV